MVGSGTIATCTVILFHSFFHVPVDLFYFFPFVHAQNAAIAFGSEE